MSIKWHVEINDGIMAERIVIEGRRIDNPRSFGGATHAHRAMRTVAKRNARAWIDLPYAPGHKLILE